MEAEPGAAPAPVEGCSSGDSTGEERLQTIIGTDPALDYGSASAPKHRLLSTRSRAIPQLDIRPPCASRCLLQPQFGPQPQRSCRQVCGHRGLSSPYNPRAARDPKLLSPHRLVLRATDARKYR